MTSNGNGTMLGATMSGLNTMLTHRAARPPRSCSPRATGRRCTAIRRDATANGTKTFQYDSCQVAKAAGGLASYSVYPERLDGQLRHVLARIAFRTCTTAPGKRPGPSSFATAAAYGSPNGSPGGADERRRRLGSSRRSSQRAKSPAMRRPVRAVHRVAAPRSRCCATAPQPRRSRTRPSRAPRATRRRRRRGRAAGRPRRAASRVEARRASACAPASRAFHVRATSESIVSPSVSMFGLALAKATRRAARSRWRMPSTIICASVRAADSSSNAGSVRAAEQLAHGTVAVVHRAVVAARPRAEQREHRVGDRQLGRLQRGEQQRAAPRAAARRRSGASPAARRRAPRSRTPSRRSSWRRR